MSISSSALFNEQVRKEREDAFVESLAHMGDTVVAEVLRLTQLINVEASRVQSLSARMNTIKNPKNRRKNLKKLSAARQTLIHLQGKFKAITDAALETASSELRMKYRAICAVPRVLEVFVERSHIICITDVLYGKDNSGRWRRIGRFRISCHLANPTAGGIRWINLDGARAGYQGPPNIRIDGAVSCMGSEAPFLIADAAQKQDYAAIFQVAVRYPECVGRQNTIELWPVVDASEVPEWYIATFGA